jgi:DNA-directed RNA polymerase specialized sigma24 family protein
MFGWPNQTDWTNVVEPAGKSRSARQRRALNQLLTIYDTPICAYITTCVKHFGPNPLHDPNDLSQRFVEFCLDGKMSFRSANRDRGSFRNWLKKVLRNFVIREWKNAQGIRTRQQGPDYPAMFPDDASRTAEEVLDHAWARTVLARAEARHRASCIDVRGGAEYDLIFRYLSAASTDQGGMQYLAEALGASNAAARTRVTRFRDKFCKLILDEVQNYVLDQQHLEEEMKTWFAPCWKRIQRGRKDT